MKRERRRKKNVTKKKESKIRTQFEIYRTALGKKRVCMREKNIGKKNFFLCYVYRYEWVYFRWIRYNNFQKTEIVESINAGFILVAPTTHYIFICFSLCVSVSRCFHLLPQAMCPTHTHTHTGSRLRSLALSILDLCTLSRHSQLHRFMWIRIVSTTGFALPLLLLFFSSFLFLALMCVRLCLMCMRWSTSHWSTTVSPSAFQIAHLYSCKHTIFAIHIYDECTSTHLWTTMTTTHNWRCATQK